LRVFDAVIHSQSTTAEDQTVRSDQSSDERTPTEHGDWFIRDGLANDHLPISRFPSFGIDEMHGDGLETPFYCTYDDSRFSYNCFLHLSDVSANCEEESKYRFPVVPECPGEALAGRPFEQAGIVQS
jgi:hypothetical protein